MLDSRDFELIAFSWIGTPFPFAVRSDLRQLLRQQLLELVHPRASTSWSTRSAETVDVVERTELANQADVMLWDYVSRFRCTSGPDLAAVNANLANFGAFGFQTPVDWEDVGWMS